MRRSSKYSKTNGAVPARPKNKQHGGEARAPRFAAFNLAVATPATRLSNTQRTRILAAPKQTHLFLLAYFLPVAAPQAYDDLPVERAISGTPLLTATCATPVHSLRHLTGESRLSSIPVSIQSFSLLHHTCNEPSPCITATSKGCRKSPNARPACLRLNWLRLRWLPCRSFRG